MKIDVSFKMQNKIMNFFNYFQDFFKKINVDWEFVRACIGYCFKIIKKNAIERNVQISGFTLKGAKVS